MEEHLITCEVKSRGLENGDRRKMVRNDLPFLPFIGYLDMQFLFVACL